MGSNSRQTDRQETNNNQTILDRRAVQQSGQQIIDSLVVPSDSQTVGAALADVRVWLDGLSRSQGFNLSTALQFAERVQRDVIADRIGITSAGRQMLDRAVTEMRAMREDQGAYVRLADRTVGNAMSMAERVAHDQAVNQNQALELLAESRTGDGAMQNIAAMVFIFAVIVIGMTRGTK